MIALQSFTARLFRAPAILVGVAILLWLIRWNFQRLRVKKLGSRAPAAVYWAPFGNYSTQNLLLEIIFMLSFRS